MWTTTALDEKFLRLGIIKKITVLILLDLSKAFDSINHQRLLKKLTSVGASPATVKWFESYLSHRTQTLRIGSTLSDPLTISHGVPQGAILSPLLFCIYTNDLPNTPLTCEIESYVDDSKILRSFHTPESETAMLEIEEDLHRVAIWCCENHLLINPEKTKFSLARHATTYEQTTCTTIPVFPG